MCIFLKFPNNAQHKNLSPLSPYNSKSIFPTSDSFPLIMSQLCNFPITNFMKMFNPCIICMPHRRQRVKTTIYNTFNCMSCCKQDFLLLNYMLNIEQQLGGLLSRHDIRDIWYWFLRSHLVLSLMILAWIRKVTILQFVTCGLLVEIEIFVTWSRRMSQMSQVLILCYELKQVANSYVLQCLGSLKNCPYLYSQTSDCYGGLDQNVSFQMDK